MKKQMLIIAVLLMTTFIGFGIIIPVLPEIVSHFHLNMLLAVYSAVSFVMSPLWGRLSDRVGRRPVILLGIIGYSVSFFILGLAWDTLWLLYLSRMLGGLFSGALMSSAVAYVADITTEENRTKGMGLVGMSIGLGFIFGPAAGGLLSVFGYSVPFFTSAALSAVTFVFIWFMLKESLSREKRSHGGRAGSRWQAFAGPLKHLYVIGFLVTFTLAGLEGTLQYYEMKKIGATPLDIGFMFLISGIVGALIQGGVVRRYIKKGDEQKFIRLGLLLSALGFFLLLFSASFWTAALFLSVFSAGNALIRPCVTSLITQKTTVGQGVASGLMSSMDSLGRITGPLLGTAVYHVHISLPFIVGGILCLAAIWFLQRFLALDLRPAERRG
jgi:multidrug resistance protein